MNGHLPTRSSCGWEGWAGRVVNSRLHLKWKTLLSHWLLHQSKVLDQNKELPVLTGYPVTAGHNNGE